MCTCNSKVYMAVHTKLTGSEILYCTGHKSADSVHE